MGSDGQVTLTAVLFNDMVGSTELLVRAGEAEADRTRIALEQITRDVVDAHGGEVVKNLGDGTMVVFASASSALAAATRLHQETDRWGRGADRTTFRLRIGVAIGDVIADGGDYYGIAVVEARRLEAAAPPGRTWTSESTLRSARDSASFPVKSVGRTELKGLPAPVDVVELGWEPLPDEATAADPRLPPVVGSAGALPFAGRTEVLDLLRAAWTRAGIDGPTMVLLEGEPGIGKTRTTGEFAREVLTGGGRVLGGRCDEDLRVPFGPLGEALRWYVERADLHSSELMLGRDAGELVRLDPGLAARLPGLATPEPADEATARRRLLDACESWLTAGGAETAPTLLVLDDLQWADPGTLLLVRHLVHGSQPGLLIVGTFRDTDVGDAHPLSPVLADLRRLPGVTRTRLDGLDAAEVRELLTRTSGRSLVADAEEFSDRIRERTSGNPFFLGELLRHLAEDGTLEFKEGHWTAASLLADVVVPDGAHEVVMRRVRRLSESSAAVLRAASIIGQNFDVDVVAAASAIPVMHVVDALESATSANLVEEIGAERFRFAHALVRDVLYDGLSATRRVRLHRVVAEFLEQRHHEDLAEVAVELAWHWTTSGVAEDPRRPVESALAAAHHSLDRGAPEGSIEWFERALDFAGDDPSLAPRRREALLGRATAERMTGDRSYRSTATLVTEEALAADDAETARAALLVHARFGYSVEQQADPGKVALLREALDRLTFSPTHRVEVLGLLATELLFQGEIAERHRLLDEIDQLLPMLPVVDRGALIANSAIWHFSAYDRSTYAARAEDIATALAIRAGSGEEGRGTERGSVEWVCEARYFLTYLSCFLGDRPSLDTNLDGLRAVTERSVDPVWRMWAEVTEAFVAVVDGRIDDAEEWVGAFTATMERANAPEAAAWGAMGAIAVGRERGTLADLLPTIGPFLAIATPGGPVMAAIAYLQAMVGDPEEARRLIDGLVPNEIADDGALAFSLPLFCEAAARVGSPEVCRSLLDFFAHWETMHLACGPVYAGAADRIAALLLDRLGDHAAADVRFSSAVEQHEGMRSAPWVARTHLDWADSLRARGDVDAAAGHARAALDSIGALDLPDLRTRADGLLSAATDRR